MVDLVSRRNNNDTGNQWIFGLAFSFILVIMSVVLIPVVDDYVRPSLISASTLTGASLAEYIDNVNFVMTMVKFTPFILSFVVVVFLILTVTRKERQEFVI
jgi:hypothetical protein